MVETVGNIDMFDMVDIVDMVVMVEMVEMLDMVLLVKWSWMNLISLFLILSRHNKISI